MDKLTTLESITGTPIMEMLEEGTYDCVCQGICTNPDCSYTQEVEPDQNAGFCPECNTMTVTSALVLAGIL